MKHVFLLFAFLLSIASANAQALNGVSPAIATKGQTLNLSVSTSGIHFHQYDSLLWLYLWKSGTQTSLSSINSFSAKNDSTITVNITLTAADSAGIYYLGVGFRHADGIQIPNEIRVYRDSTFIVSNSGAKSISINPATAAKGQTLNVTITGTNTTFIQGSNTLTFFGQGSSSAFMVNSLNVASPTQMNASVTVPPTAAAGQYNVKLATIADGTLNISNGFTVPGSVITSSSPAIAQRGQTLNVTITGTNTHFDQGTATVSFFKSGSPVSNLSVNFATPQNATSMIASVTVPSTAALGSYNLRVEDPIDGQLNLTNALAVQAGSLSGITPNTSPRGQTLLVTITGNGTAFTQGSTTLSFFKSGTSSAINVNSIVVNSSSLLTASITIQPNAIVGSYDVKVTSPLDGALTLYAAFQVTGATISSVTPAILNRGTKLNLTISGANTHFDQGTGTSVYFFRQGSPTSFIAVDSTKATGATNLTAYVTVDRYAPGGAYRLYAYNPTDNEMIYGNTITVQNPAIASITPSSSPNNRVLDVAITGKGTNFTQASATNFGFFLSGSSTSNITIDTMQAVNDSIAILKVNVLPTAVSGFYIVKYQGTEDGILQSSFVVSPGTASILSVTPPSGSPGQVLDVTITGLNTAFMQSSATNTLTFMQQGTATAYITVSSVTPMSDNVLNAHITIDTAITPGPYTVTVTNSIDGTISSANGFVVLHVGMDDVIPRAGTISLYPNPVHDLLTIKSYEPDAAITAWMIFDLTGRKLAEVQHPEMDTDGTMRVSINNFHLQQGTYFTRTITGKRSYYHKLFIE